MGHTCSTLPPLSFLLGRRQGPLRLLRGRRFRRALSFHRRTRATRGCRLSHFLVWRRLGLLRHHSRHCHLPKTILCRCAARLLSGGTGCERVCVSVCVCERERAIERGRERQTSARERSRGIHTERERERERERGSRLLSGGILVLLCRGIRDRLLLRPARALALASSLPYRGDYEAILV